MLDLTLALHRPLILVLDLASRTLHPDSCIQVGGRESQRP